MSKKNKDDIIKNNKIISDWYKSIIKNDEKVLCVISLKSNNEKYHTVSIYKINDIDINELADEFIKIGNGIKNNENKNFHMN